MAKVVHDVVASELDFIRLCERLGTEECIMTESRDSDGISKMELDLCLSLFREGYNYASAEVMGRAVVEPSRQAQHMRSMNDASYAAGYSVGSTIAEQAMENYRQLLLGGCK